MVGIPPKDFWELTMRELTNVVEGWKKKEKIEWERARMLSWYSAGPHIKDLKISDIKVPGDEEEEAPQIKGKGVKFLTKDELREKWKQSGLILSEDKLEEMYGE